MGLEQVFWGDVQRFQKTQRPVAEIDRAEYEKRKIAFLEELHHDKRAFVRGALRVLRERYHRHVCVILDNADQCDADYQRAVYLFARTLEDELRCLVIVALREEWYWHFGRRGGPLDAYHDVVYHIPAPRTRDVLARRLDYAIQLATQYDIPHAHATLSHNIALEAAHLAKYLAVCKRAFFNNEDISLFFECLSNGSVRKGLSAFLEFVRSGHTHVDEYLKAIFDSQNYTLSFHQVFKSVAYGPYKWYSSERSLVPNVLHPVKGSTSLQLSWFTRVYLLRYLSRFRSTSSSVGVGYVPIGDARNLVLSLGLDPGHVQSLIRDLFESELVEPEVRLLRSLEACSYIRITAWGYYVVGKLLVRFPYLEAIMLDTPLPDVKLLDHLVSTYGSKPPLRHRLASVRRFLECMSVPENEEQTRAETAGIGDQCPPVIPLIKEGSEADFSAIQSAIERQAQDV